MEALSFTAGVSSFDPEARRLAIAESLPLLASYFSSAETWDVTVQPAVSDVRGQLDADLARAVRLRVMLALAQELLPILQAILARPTFRYFQRADESAGLLAGRLDIARYVQRRSGRTAPKVYPVRVVERQHATPENALAVDALAAISKSLRAVPTDVLPNRASPESRLLVAVRGDLRRYERMPLVREIARSGGGSRRRALAQQRRDVVRRIERGDVRQPEPYRRLTDWVASFLTGVGIDPEARPWAFYDDHFDPRLLEIWTLGALAACLTRRYGPPDGGAIAPLWARQQGAVAVWTTPYGRVDVFFQRETSAIGLPGRWMIPSNGHRLRAIPDLCLRVTRAGSAPAWLLLDCKLRRHQPLSASSSGAGANGEQADAEPETGLDLPTEELYKLLGYFDHLVSDSRAVGALVYYTPGGNGTLELDAQVSPQRKGHVTLVGVDPAEPADAQLAVCGVADQVGILLGEPGEHAIERAKVAAKHASDAGGDSDEVKAAYKQELLVQVLSSYAHDHKEQLPAVKKLTESWFSAQVWNSLDEDTRRMVLSAELYGSQQLDDLDHSGPLLVLCAACERELNLRLFARIVSAFPDERSADGSHLLDSHATLGGAIEVAHKGWRIARARSRDDHAAEERILADLDDEDAARRAVLTAQYLGAQSANLPSVKKLLGRLRGVNIKYRRPSAHDEVVEAGPWAEGRGRILGREGLLSQIVESLP